MKEIEKLVDRWHKEGANGKMWSCNEARNRICHMAPGGKGKLKRYVAEANQLTKRVLKLISRNDAKVLGNPAHFETKTKCAEGVIKAYRKNTDKTLQNLDSKVRHINRDFYHLQFESNEVTAFGGLGKVLGVLGRAVTAVTSALLYLVAVPFVLFNEGRRYVEETGSLWYFPVGFLFRGPIVSIFGKVHWKWFGDFGDNEDNDLFRWGIWGAATRGWSAFHRPSVKELAEDVPNIMNTLAHLHFMLDMAQQCQETIGAGK